MKTWIKRFLVIAALAVLAGAGGLAWYANQPLRIEPLPKTINVMPGTHLQKLERDAGTRRRDRQRTGVLAARTRAGQGGDAQGRGVYARQAADAAGTLCQDPARRGLAVCGAVHRRLELARGARSPRRATHAEKRKRRHERCRTAAGDRRRGKPPRRPAVSRYLFFRAAFVRPQRAAPRLPPAARKAHGRLGNPRVGPAVSHAV